MAAIVLTKDDLQEFRSELLVDLKELLNEHFEFEPKRWLRSQDVRALLHISPGTLQNLRINGTLPYSKVGGVIYYEYADIVKVMQSSRFHNV